MKAVTFDSSTTTIFSSYAPAHTNAASEPSSFGHRYAGNLMTVTHLQFHAHLTISVTLGSRSYHQWMGIFNTV